MLGCKVGKVPFLYLGLPVGGNPQRLSFWDPIVNRIKSRLSGWNSLFLSFGGCLILLKSVLTSLPALSFFKAPSGKLLRLVEILFVRQRSLEVWRWEVGGRGRSCSSWWREVGRIREGGGDVGDRWFGDNVVRKVGDGNDMLFWSHRWLGGSALCECFPRLFELAENKLETVAMSSSPLAAWAGCPSLLRVGRKSMLARITICTGERDCRSYHCIPHEFPRCIRGMCRCKYSGN
ncbi:Nodule Cysteine-Rich (NCR) secreted peptide [Medicago truncatula]|uniref:Nodule Cysteine-Rich (NCR) secreted peptide n=1 Tax=Medicago truncatula TaxID=3880 RepID=A0A072U8P7_MEDTR|nr:Nodule Cysteine-Rich (NCR) secreted peptide [Medicago truncatula]